MESPRLKMSVNSRLFSVSEGPNSLLLLLQRQTFGGHIQKFYLIHNAGKAADWFLDADKGRR